MPINRNLVNIINKDSNALPEARRDLEGTGKSPNFAGFPQCGKCVKSCCATLARNKTVWHFRTLPLPVAKTLFGQLLVDDLSSNGWEMGL